MKSIEEVLGWDIFVWSHDGTERFEFGWRWADEEEEHEICPTWDYIPEGVPYPPSDMAMIDRDAGEMTWVSKTENERVYLLKEGNNLWLCFDCNSDVDRGWMAWRLLQS